MFFLALNDNNWLKCSAFQYYKEGFLIVKISLRSGQTAMFFLEEKNYYPRMSKKL